MMQFWFQSLKARSSVFLYISLHSHLSSGIETMMSLPFPEKIVLLCRHPLPFLDPLLKLKIQYINIKITPFTIFHISCINCRNSALKCLKRLGLCYILLSCVLKLSQMCQTICKPREIRLPKLTVSFCPT